MTLPKFRPKKLSGHDLSPTMIEYLNLHCWKSNTQLKLLFKIHADSTRTTAAVNTDAIEYEFDRDLDFGHNTVDTPDSAKLVLFHFYLLAFTFSALVYHI